MPTRCCSLFVLAALLVATGGCAAASPPRRYDCPAERLVSPRRLPLHTRGGAVVDQQGCVVAFACVNWYGAHMELFSVDGLHKQPLDRIVQRIVSLGFNCVRLPFSLQLLYEDPVVPEIALAANAGLKGIRAMALLDLSIKRMTDAGLMVVLNNHNSAAGWCCDGSSEEGMWHTSRYPMQAWLEGIARMGARYRGNALVVAFDIRNEIHDVGDVKLTWGTSDDETRDWRVASTKGAQVLQEVSPDILVILTGLCYGHELRAMRRAPPKLKLPNKLVYTSHAYHHSLWWNVLKDHFKVPARGRAAWSLLASKVTAVGIALAVFAVVNFVLCAWMYTKSLQGVKSKEHVQIGIYRELLFTTGLWIMLVPGVLMLVAGFLWKMALDMAQCNIAGAESHSLMIGAAICGVGLGLVILIYTCCVLKAGGASPGNVDDGAAPVELETNFDDKCPAETLNPVNLFSDHPATSSSEGLRAAGEGAREVNLCLLSPKGHHRASSLSEIVVSTSEADTACMKDEGAMIQTHLL